MTGEDIVIEARTWIGTPFFHTGRQKGVACDCVGLVACVAHELDLTEYDTRDYSPVMADGELRRKLAVVFVEAGHTDIGDVLLFRIGRLEQHIAIFAGDTIIHARQDVGYVCEHEFTAKWQSRATGSFKWRALV